MDINQLHTQAMDIADAADIAKMRDQLEESSVLYKQAFELERDAAIMAFRSGIGEPSISILLRSAASLALECKLFRECEQLIGLALSGTPPEICWKMSISGDIFKQKVFLLQKMNSS